MSFNIEPNGRLYICRGVHLDDTYTHSIRFETPQKQYKYFQKKIKASFENYTYIRESGSVKVESPADELRDCNYMMFNNRTFGSRWFYAFITDVAYVSPNVCEISFEIDVLQTWWFDFKVGSCFVEREHQATDVAGDNLLDEGLECGDYNKYPIHYENGDLVRFDDSHYLAAVVTNVELDVLGLDDERSNANLIGNYSPTAVASPNKTSCYAFNDFWVYSGLCLEGDEEYFNERRPYYNLQYGWTKWRGESVINVGEFVHQISLLGNNNTVKNVFGNRQVSSSTSGDNIVDVYIYPAYMSSILNYGYQGFRVGTETRQVAFDVPNFGGYTPKNNKLKTYPYQFLSVTNHRGTEEKYRYENFETNRVIDCNTHYDTTAKVTFAEIGTTLNPVTTVCAPLKHKKQAIDFDEATTTSSYPVCEFRVDQYQTWLQGHRNQFATSMLTSVIGAGTTAALGIPKIGDSFSKRTGGKRIETREFDVYGPHNQVVNVGRTITQKPSKTTYYHRYDPMEIARPLTSNLGDIAGTLAQVTDQKHIPPKSAGQASQIYISGACGVEGYHFFNWCVKPEYAKIIDDYFTMFGYATRRVKVPNIMVGGNAIRPYFNYIKTDGCIVHAIDGRGVTAGVESVIEDIFNRGITFWEETVEIGDYTVDNSPKGGNA